MVFAMPTALFPVLALDVFQVGPAGLGLMAAAPAFGAFFGALFSGWVSNVVRVGRAVVLAVIGWGVAITGFGITTFLVGPWAFPLALLLLAVAGAADMLSAIFRATIVQLGHAGPPARPGHVDPCPRRDRGPRVGDIESALLAAIIGPGRPSSPAGSCASPGSRPWAAGCRSSDGTSSNAPRPAEADLQASPTAG